MGNKNSAIKVNPLNTEPKQKQKEKAKESIVSISYDDFIRLYDVDVSKEKIDECRDIYEKVMIKMHGNYDLCSYDVAELNFLGLYHTLYTKNYKIAKKCFLEAIKYNYLDSIYNLGCLYVKTQQFSEALDYFLYGISCGDESCLLECRNLLSDTQLYCLLLQATMPNKLINDTMDQLEKKDLVKCFVNKIEKMAIAGICEQCNNNGTIALIPRECTHYCCAFCYADFNQCHKCNMVFDFKKIENNSQ